MKWNPTRLESNEHSKSRMPIVLRATDEEVDPVQFVMDFQSNVQEALLEHGAILFRGFTVDVPTFSRFAEVGSRRRLNYVYRSTPRDQITEKVFTATKYPADLEIPMHCENSYQRDWPMRLMFFCAEPSMSGGETPLADVNKVTQVIGKDLMDKFEELGVMYVRNYGVGADLPWHEVFQTKERTEVERYCKSNGIEFNWTESNNLRTSQVCQGVAAHPVKLDKIFFNQSHLFHYTSVGEKNGAMLLKVFGETKLPRNAFYGDGSKIGETELSTVRKAFHVESKAFAWQKGDILILDNMQIAHGRRAFRGSRNVLVSMSDPYSEVSTNK